jgi:hypothetical protein
MKMDKKWWINYDATMQFWFMNDALILLEWNENENKIELNLDWKMSCIWWWNEVSWIVSNKIKELKINEKVIKNKEKGKRVKKVH